MVRYHGGIIYIDGISRWNVMVGYIDGFMGYHGGMPGWDNKVGYHEYQKTAQNILIQSGIPSLTVLLVRACDSIYSYFNMFSLTYGASPAVILKNYF